YLLSQRRNRQAYPIYLTGLELSSLSSGNSASTIELFNFKRRLEQRLCEAMALLSKDGVTRGRFS
ncbi:MAG TPA: hypothetical protein PLZ16_12785, partial [Gammaproteobacteria bacterium]|nr:hypothetical protein [Gammaproteobacteria bacterium]